MGLRIALWPRLPPGGQGCQCFASLRAGGDGWLADCGGMGSLRHTGGTPFHGDAPAPMPYACAAKWHPGYTVE